MAYNTQVRHNFGYNIFCCVNYKMIVKIYLLCIFGIYSMLGEALIEHCTSHGKIDDYCQGHFNSCICTDLCVECHNEEILKGDITKLFPYIKDDVVNITITGCMLTELPKNTFGSCLHDGSLVLKSLKRVDFSNNSITQIHGKSFHCMSNLERLILQDNEWEVDMHPTQTGYFTSLPNLKHLDLNNTFDEVWNGSVHITKLARVFNETNMDKLETLKLGYNEFFSFSISAANSFCQLRSLKMLDLSHNNLDYPSLPNKPDCMEMLETLDLSYNKMPVLPYEFMDKLEKLKNLKSVKLDNNPYQCDCGLIETWTWLNTTKCPVNKGDMICAAGYHSSYIGKPIHGLLLSDLMCTEFEPPSNSAVKAVTGIIFAIIGITLVAFLIVNRVRFQLMMKKWKKRLPNVHFRTHQGYAAVQEVAVI